MNTATNSRYAILAPKYWHIVAFKLFSATVVTCFAVLASTLMAWAQNEPQKSASPLPAVSCSLSTVTQSWQQGKPAIVAIELKNDAGAAVDLDVVPYLVLVEIGRR